MRAARARAALRRRPARHRRRHARGRGRGARRAREQAPGRRAARARRRRGRPRGARWRHRCARSPHPHAARLGAVGAIDGVDPSLLHALLAHGPHAGAREHRRDRGGRAAQRERRRRGGRARRRARRERPACCSPTRRACSSTARSCPRWTPRTSPPRSRAPTSAAAWRPSCAPRRAALARRRRARAHRRVDRHRTRSPHCSRGSGAGTTLRRGRARTAPQEDAACLTPPALGTRRSPASPAPRTRRCSRPLYPLPRLELVAGHGARVRDVAGREYLDFVSGIAVNAFGHTPDGLADAVAAQLRTLGPGARTCSRTRPALALAEALTQATGYPRVFFCNSGTEGIEAALKFARARAGARGLPGRDIARVPRRLSRPHRASRSRPPGTRPIARRSSR